MIVCCLKAAVWPRREVLIVRGVEFNRTETCWLFDQNSSVQVGVPQRVYVYYVYVIFALLPSFFSATASVDALCFS